MDDSYKSRYYTYQMIAHEKIAQILNYIAHQAGSSDAINRLKALKLIYFADRYHLRRYGRSVSNDDYFAMVRPEKLCLTCGWKSRSGKCQGTG